MNRESFIHYSIAWTDMILGLFPAPRKIHTCVGGEKGNQIHPPELGISSDDTDRGVYGVCL